MLTQIPFKLSNDTISSRKDMSDHILAQVFIDLISNPTKVSFQLDETNDVSTLSQLVVFVRYDVIKEYFLQQQTKAADVKELVDDVFRVNDLS